MGLTAGCALTGDVRGVELKVEALRVERARADSQRAAEIDTVRALLRSAQEKLTAQQAYLVQLRGDLKTDLLAVQQQLVSVQELTGQSQQRLTELRGRLEEQARQPVPALDTSRGGAAVRAGVPRRGAGGAGGGAEVRRPGHRPVRPPPRGQPRARQAPAPGAVASPASAAGVWGGPACRRLVRTGAKCPSSTTSRNCAGASSRASWRSSWRVWWAG